MKMSTFANWFYAKNHGDSSRYVEPHESSCQSCFDKYEGVVFDINDTENLPPLHDKCTCSSYFYLLEN